MDWKYGQQKNEREMNKRILVTGGTGMVGNSLQSFYKYTPVTA